MEFLGLTVNSKTMTLALTEEKVKKIIKQCLDLSSRPQIRVLDLTKMLGTLSSTIQEVLPARLQIATTTNCSLMENRVLLIPRSENRGYWSREERVLHINVLEMIAIKLALLSFHKMMNFRSVHLQVDNNIVLSYFLKMGGTVSKELIQLSIDIWQFLFAHQIMITAEYLPSSLNVTADWEQPEIDLFASRLSN